MYLSLSSFFVSFFFLSISIYNVLSLSSLSSRQDPREEKVRQDSYKTRKGKLEELVSLRSYDLKL
jgi:hypothetical protein